jgi:sugar phosphate isomerase/epimerase
MLNKAAAKAGFEIGVSLAAFKDLAEIEAFEADYRLGHGSEPLFELSYELGEKSLEGLGRLRGRVLSVHAPCPGGEYFPNFGSRESAVRADALETVRRSAGTTAEFGAHSLVLHPGYTTDAAVFMDSKRRLATLEATIGDDEWLWVRRGSICRPGFCSSPRYLVHRDRALDGLALAQAVCEEEGVLLAVENLNPRVSYLFQLPSEIVQLTERLPGVGLCVDIGHLWISSVVHAFDFSEGLRTILGTGRVATAHVHDNASRPGDPPVCGDDHALVGSGNVPIRESLRAFAEARLRRIVIEAKSLPAENFGRIEELIAELGL